MNKDTVDRFKRLFETQRSEALTRSRLLAEDLSISPDDLCDEADQAALDIERTMRLRLKSRELFNLEQISQALQRIVQGQFGECNECNEDIELRRLEAKPTATLCVKCKEEQERLEIQIAPQMDSRSQSTASLHSRRYAF